MNILVLCDQFTKGGLETHIAAYAEALRERHTVWIVCSHYEPTGLVQDAQVLSGFHFSFYDTVAALRSDTERLVSIIREKQIDVLHVHPWFCLYTACFAAAETGVKLVTTVHGFVSLNYNGNLYDELWMRDILTNAVGHAFSVSRLGLEMLGSIRMHRASLLPNGIDLSRFQRVSPADNRRWAMVTRLDADKLGAVEALVRMLPDLEIDAVDIYGDGSGMAQAQEIAAACPKPVRLLGHTSEVHLRLREDYFGVIGLGRCAAEGLAMGLPVLLAGYGKVCGVLEPALYERAAAMNFVTETLPALGTDALNAQLRAVYANPEAYDLSEAVRRDLDVRTLAERMAQTIADTPAGMPLYIGRLYAGIAALPDETPVHESREVFRLVRDALLSGTQDLSVKAHLLQQLNEERERGGAVYDLRVSLGELDSRLFATRTEMHAADQAALRETADLRDRLSRQVQAQADEQAALRAQLLAAQETIRELTARLDAVTLGYLLRQTVEWKILRPLRRLFRREP